VLDQFLNLYQEFVLIMVHEKIVNGRLRLVKDESFEVQLKLETFPAYAEDSEDCASLS
jgi:hypothetical protein